MAVFANTFEKLEIIDLKKNLWTFWKTFGRRVAWVPLIKATLQECMYGAAIKEMLEDDDWWGQQPEATGS
jgi:hypothetical protein